MPNSTIQFLSLDEVLAIHEQLIEVFGGPAGVRDMGMLESALYRPQTGYYDGINQMSAALFESLLMNHPFVDGNKRAAFFVTDTFLRLNGYRIKVEPRTAHAFIVGLLESNKVNFETLATWIKNNFVPLES